MKNRCSGYSSDSEKTKQKEDLSVLRKPILTSLSGFIEAKKAYENGTEEIRRLLARECDIIYECNECRNIFRSLTNFISHKRVYCRNSHDNFSNNNFNFHNKGFVDQDVSTIIQAEQDYGKKCETGSNKEASNKDLSSIIERLLQREQANQLLDLPDYYEQVNNKLTQDEVLKKKHTLQLDNVPNSSVAVYQTIKNKDSDNIRAEVNELDELLNNDRTTLGPDGKILKMSSTANTTPLNIRNNFSATITGKLSNINNNSKSTEITCNICHISFTTEKTLKLHIQAKHIASTYVYQCPSCSQTFLQPAAVIRHLVNEHNKTNRKVRVMRDSILKRRVRVDEIQTKGPSRELARLQTDKEKKAAEDKAWLDNFEGGNDSPMCTFCGKTFDRKAVLTTHLNSCPSKDKPSVLMTKKSCDIVINTKQHDVMTELSENTKFKSNQTGSILNDFKEKLNFNDNSVEKPEPKETEVTTTRRKRRKAPKKSIFKHDDIDPDTLNEMFKNLGKDTLKLNTISFDNLHKICNNEEKNPDSEPSTDDKDQILAKTEADTQLNEVLEKVDGESAVVVVKSRPKKSVKHSQKVFVCLCKICKKKFDTLSNLRRHISMFHYRSRKFGCTICEYRAFRRYDVINHLNAIHFIVGEKETIIKYVSTHDEKINRVGIDEDIVVITPNGSPEVHKSVQKRSRRPRIISSTPNKPIPTEEPFLDSGLGTGLSTPINFIEQIKEKILQSPTRTVLHEPKLTRGRPIRNRVKPVKKDFLYDLSSILKKDPQYVDKETGNRKRRSTTNSADEICSNGLIIPTNSISSEHLMLAKGAALKMAKSAIISGRAKFGTYNELSINGSPRKPIISINSDNDEPEALNEFKPYNKPSISEHSVIQKYSKRRRVDVSGRARQPLIKKSTISTLFNRVDVNMNGDNKPSSTNDQHMDITNGNNNEFPGEITKKKLLGKDFENFLTANKSKTQFVDPSTSIPNKIQPTSAPGKRIPMVQRTKDNNNKKLKDSLLRSALEH